MNKDVRIMLLCLCVVVVEVFFRCLGADFINYDDNILIYENPLVFSFQWNDFLSFYTIQKFLLYPPLSILSFAFEFKIFHLNPFIYHLDNLILHLVNVLLVYILLVRMKFDDAGAFIVAALFALSPLRVESVAWISQRRDLLYAFFYLLGLIACVDCIRHQSRWRGFVLVGVFFILSVCSKIQGLMFPLVAFALSSYLNEDDPVFVSKIRKLILLIMAVGIMLAGFILKEFHFLDYVFSNLSRVMLVINEALFFYLIKPFFPSHLAFIYPNTEIFKPEHLPWIYIKFFVNCLLLYFMVRFSLKNRGGAFGLAMFFFNILIVLMIPLYGFSNQDITASYNDHYTYLASFGLYIVAVSLVLKFLNYKPQYKRVVCFGFGLYLLCMGAMTFERCGVWKNTYTLFSDQIAKFPESTIGYNNRAEYLLNHNKPELALMDLNAIFMNKTATITFQNYLNRAHAYALLGKTDLAIQDLTSAISLNRYATLYMLRARLWLDVQNPEESFNDLKEAEKINPKNPEVIEMLLFHYQKNNNEDKINEYTAKLNAVQHLKLPPRK